MNKIKKLLVLLLALAIVLSLAACGGNKTANDTNTDDSGDDSERDAQAAEVDSSNNAQTSDERYDSVVIGISVEINALDPGDPNGGCKPQVGWEVYESLFDIDGFGGEMYPVLAKSYTVIDDLHYQVELYDYIHDSEGNAITADDVIFSYQVALDAGANTVIMTYIDSMTKIDDYTVEFAWKTAPTPVGDLEAMLAKVWVFSQKAYEESTDGFATKPIASGPYVVTDFVAGASVTMEANDNYWQTDESLIYQQHQRNVQSIRFDTITEPSQMLVALQSNTIDYADKLAYDSVQAFAEGGQYAEGHSLDVYQDNQIIDLLPNCSEKSICNDQNFRLALFYAIDTVQLCGAVNGDTTPLTTFCNSNYVEYSEDFADAENYITDYDPDLAKEYLEASSYNGETIKMLLSNNETFQNVGQILQILWLNNLGVNVEFLTYDNATVKEYKEYDDMWDLCLENRGSTDYAVTYLKGVCDGATKHTAMWVTDDKLQELISSLESVDGHNAEGYAAFHNYVVEQAYWMPLFSNYIYGVYSSSITGVCKTAKNYILPGGCTYDTSI